MIISKRHLAKTITWRLVGTFDTMLLSWAITAKFETGLKIGLAELLTKMILYYVHERAWFSSRKFKSSQRHVIKTFTWRGIGTIDTILLGWLFSGNHLIGLKIGIFEVVTKMVLYYMHEKIWYKFNFGLSNDNRLEKSPKLANNKNMVK